MHQSAKKRVNEEELKKEPSLRVSLHMVQSFRKDRLTWECYWVPGRAETLLTSLLTT